MKPLYKSVNSAENDSLGVKLHIVSPGYPSTREFTRGRALLALYTSVVALFAAAFLGLSILVKANDTLQFDVKIGHWIQGTNPPALIAWLTQSSIYSWVLTNLSAIGNSPWSYVSYAGVFLVLFVLGLRIEAGVALGGSVLAAVAGSLLRTFIDRARPSVHFLNVAQHISGAGFPSGHVMMYVTLFGFAFYVVLIAWRWNALKVITLTVLALLVILIGMSRVYLGAHWPTDTTGAYLLGWLFVAGMIEVHRTLVHRFAAWREAPVRSTVQKGAQPV